MDEKAVQQGLHIIKTQMPHTYAEIQRLAGVRGKEVFRLVRQGCGGAADCFYAIENGHVVGTPFGKELTDPTLAALIVQYEMGFFMMVAST